MASLHSVSDPSRPWLKNPEWAAGRVVHRPLIRAPVLLLGILFFVLPPTALFIRGSAGLIAGTGNFTPAELAALAFLCMVFFVIFGLLAVVWWRYRKFGPSECRLETIPGVIGGEFKAKVYARWPSRPTGEVTTRLSNLRVAGKSVVALWEAALSVAPGTLEQLEINRFAIPVRFQIPADVPRPTGGAIRWELDVRAPMPGLDYKALFVVPVFDVAGTAGRSDPHADSLGMITLIIAGVSGLGGIAIAAASLRLFAKGPFRGFLSFLSQINEPAAWVLLAVGIALSLAGPFLAIRNQKLRAKSLRPQ